MEPGVAAQIIILIILLFLSGFFSSAETAFMAVNKMRIRSAAEEGSKNAKLILSLIENPTRLLSTVLVGNNLVNICASSLTTTLMIEHFGSTAVGIATGLLTLFVLIFGEITPKTIATKKAEKLASIYAPVLNALCILLYPVTTMVNFLAHSILRLLGINMKEKDVAVTEDELLTMVDVSSEEGIIESDECEMINNVVDFGDTYAKDVMVPAINMTCVPNDISYDELIDIFKRDQYSRMPVYKDTKDNIVAVIWAKDLLVKYNPDIPFNVLDYSREAYYTYEFKKTRELMTEMRERYKSLAVVLNEYSATAGLITIEDLLEEIVGEIRDEYDTDETDSINNTGSNVYEVSGQTNLNDIEEELGIKIESESYESIAGHVIHLLGHIPSEGEFAKDGNITYTVLSKDKNRIDKLKIEIDTSVAENKDN